MISEIATRDGSPVYDVGCIEGDMTKAIGEIIMFSCPREFIFSVKACFEI